ncbi:NitT/TauT family transport system ATP-binding protein [Cognatiyoonia sediminum]|uniref:NitT/TauT family transport system ATP-binding protein n=1 Tax=Cognatiyoonia sediminum TaxID=1508389 RepID=A0A1M5LEU1_9RHOB|nr:CmpA/NrtA family ABC transporter substrate-binding protein [Cognatiyoonia sediminum]SHG63460.1 NitT/TauT family transport system ATP-binding protein [Cognatiyoonia sediminum]
MTRTILNCGYVALVDSAPLIIAKELQFALEEGVELNLVRQPSWSALRDMLALGHLDAAQMLSPMPIAMTLGIGSLSAEIDALMVLSANGTAFGVSNKVAAEIGPIPFGHPHTIKRAIAARDADPLRIGLPFHHSMHRLLLSYWISTEPAVEIERIIIPPPRMADAIAEDRIDAFWVGEPWGTVAVERGIAQLLMTGRDVWQFSPEKVLAARRNWILENDADARSLTRAVYRAAQWLDAPENKPLAIEILSRSDHLDLPTELIDPGLTGQLTAVKGAAPIEIDRFLQFHRFAANFPWRSQAAWIADQLGGSKEDVNRAKSSFRSDLYRNNLEGIGVDLPTASEKVEGSLSEETGVASTKGRMILAPDAFFDGRTFDFT